MVHAQFDIYVANLVSQGLGVPEFKLAYDGDLEATVRVLAKEALHTFGHPFGVEVLREIELDDLYIEIVAATLYLGDKDLVGPVLTNYEPTEAEMLVIKQKVRRMLERNPALWGRAC